MTELRDKKVLVLGLGETGLSLVRWLVAQGAHVRAADSRDLPPTFAVLRVELPQVEIHCGAFRDETFSGIDLIAISPGIPLYEPCVARAIARGIPVVGDIELFAQQIEPLNRKPKIIAITGANGKTTVTSMVGVMCRAAGLDTEVAGNISPAVLDVLRQRNGQQPEVWVLELSSFQLETISTLNADTSTVLNVSEDHLDRYADMDAYAAAKARVFQGDGVQVLNRDDLHSLGMLLPGRQHVSFGLSEPLRDNDWGMQRSDKDIWLMQGQQRVLNANELQVAGLHNVANALAALALCRAIGLPLAPLLDALRAFKGLPHRVEQVAEINGVIYYDDSKGTNVGATVAALQGLGRLAILIAGGEGKEQDFAPLHPVVKQHARAVVLIGRDANRIAAALQGCGIAVVHAHDMDDAVRQSAALAQPGDAVLLSPACASFDMFHDYKHRAEVFVSAVHAIQEEAACVSPA
jgi:UDP-N-acetylmuramoylalanine--D-glutamate ligase